MSNILVRGLGTQARRTEAIFGCPGIGHWQPKRFAGAPAVAAEPAIEGGAAARANELARDTDLHGERQIPRFQKS
jgi:hypothetical protein